MKRISLLFDCLRAPYDAAHIIQIAQALDPCDIYLSGNCIDFNHDKIRGKVVSWGIKEYPSVLKYDSLESAVLDLHSRGKRIIGTSPSATCNFYSLDMSSGEDVIVFGTETSGLSKEKSKMMDKLTKLPMTQKCEFLTLPVVVSAVAYEINRQLGRYL